MAGTNLRTRDGLPFNFVNGLKVRGVDIEELIPGIEGIPEAGTKYQFAGNGSNTIFTLPVTPYNKDAIEVHVKQLYVHSSDYTLVGDVVTLNEAPPALDAGETYNVEIKVTLTSLNGYVNANRVSFEGENLDDILEKSKPLANYSSLRAYAGNAIQVRITDPGIAGFFYYDSTDTVFTDNGGTIIVSGTKRWKRVFDGPVNVMWFGAKGDGIADDSTAIQAALNTGKAVYMPKGIYKLNTFITLATVGQRLFGENSQATYLTGGLTHDLVRVAASHCEVDHIHFRPSGYSDVSPAVFAPLRVYAALAFIHDNRFLAAAEGHGTAILLDDVDPVTTAVVAGAYIHLIENNRIGANGYSFLYGILCFNDNNGQQATKFQNNQIVGDVGIYVYKGGGNYYAGNLLQSATGGYGIGTRVGNAIDLQPNVIGETITGNYIERYQNGIILRRAAADYLVANVYGNHFDNNDYNLISTGSGFYRFINDEILSIISNSWQENFNSQDNFKLYNRDGVEVYNINRASVSFEPRVLSHNLLQTLSFSSNGSTQTPISSWCQVTGNGDHRTGCFLGNGTRNGQHLYIRAHTWSVQLLNNPGGVQNIYFANNAANATFGQSGNIGTMHLIWDSAYGSGVWFEMSRTVA